MILDRIGPLDQQVPGHPGQAPGAERRRQQPPAGDDEYVAPGPLAEVAGRVGKDGLVRTTVARVLQGQYVFSA